MKVRKAWIAVGVATVSLTVLARCLPGDTRPPPGSVLLTVGPSEGVASGVTTADGWDIVFEKLLIALGDVAFDDEASCNDYSKLLLDRSGYDRLFDVALGGQHKLAIAYGLGACNVRFRLRPPSSEVVLSEGTTAADLALLREFTTESAVVAGRSFTVRIPRVAYVQGYGSSHMGRKVHFAWMFASARFESDGMEILPEASGTFRDCGADGDAGVASIVNLEANRALDLPITIHGEELFRATADDGAALDFEAIADADADGDGTVTLAELSKLPAPPPQADGGVDAGDGGAPATFESFVYENLVSRMIHLAKSPCALFQGTRRGGG